MRVWRCGSRTNALKKDSNFSPVVFFEQPAFAEHAPKASDGVSPTAESEEEDFISRLVDIYDVLVTFADVF